MAYAITKAGVRWFLDSYHMPMPLNLMALDTMVDLSVLNDVMENGKKAGGFLKYDEVISMITSDVEDLIRNDDSDIELQLLRIQKSINRVLN